MLTVNIKIRNVLVCFAVLLFHIVVIVFLRNLFVYSPEDIINLMKCNLVQYGNYNYGIIDIVTHSNCKYHLYIDYHRPGEINIYASNKPTNGGTQLFNDSLPNLNRYLLNNTPDDFDVFNVKFIPDTVVCFEYHHILNSNHNCVNLLYSIIKKNQLYQRYSNCRFYTYPEIPTEDTNWLYGLEDHWYIYSP